MADAPQILRRLEALQSARTPHERVWRECFLYVDPIRAEGFQSPDMSPEEVMQQRALLTDSTAADSVRTLASAILSGLVPSNSRWFGLDVGDETDEERQWLDQTAELTWENIHNSNFDAEAFEAAIDLCGGGWFVLWIDEDRERGGYVFTHYPAGSCYVSSTRADGRADTLYRPYTLTAEQAMREFGNACSDKTQKLAKDKPDAIVRFVHAVYPRTPHVVGAKLAKNLPFASCHVERDAKVTVRESGFHECPFVAPRWKRIKANSSYGVGPVADALPDIKTLNTLVRLELAAADLAVSGMWIAEDDGVLNPRTIKVGARKVIVANSVESMKPLTSGSQFDVSFTIKADLQRAIRKVLMADQLEPKDGPAMTATEVHVRVNLIRQLLGPVYGRQQPEWLQPMVERCFGLAYRAGVYAPPPESLGGRDFRVKYVSPMARAQKLEDVGAMDRFEASLGMAAQALAVVDPEGAVALFDNYDHDLAARTKAELLGVPAELVPNARDIARKRQQREQRQAQQQQQAAMQQGMAAAVAEGGKQMAARALG